MSAEQPTVLPWHREAAKDPHAAELIHAKQEWAIWERNVAACEKEIATLRSQHAETLRLLERALSHTMSTETGRIIVQDAIRAHLAAMKGTQ